MEDSVWAMKGATLSDKSARKEFGLTQDEIVGAINGGKFQYQRQYMHGNPYFRLVRGEVEAFVNEKYGGDYLEKKKLKNELASVKGRLRKLKSELAFLEKRKTELAEEIGE